MNVQSRICNTRVNVQDETNSHSLQQVKNRSICQKPYKNKIEGNRGNKSTER